MTAARIRRLLATLWVGSLWTVGYIVAPTLFSTLADRVLAGLIAGSLFRIEAWLSLVCAIAMVVLLKASPDERGTNTGRQLIWIVAGMLGCTLVGYFGLQPFMAALKEAAGAAGMQGESRAQFGILHGVASTFYLVQSLLGAALVWKLR
ncbi:MAG TPA: DUF4149 domain-containing protein [Noviherbaspirillum sp.]|uniref:DUF4149 domain-containing protein n=1 Tax=Noviherbaspirillum sp. TaxID=1926288 RepID=UPI002D6C70D7|nr:DUF4149 domain-containing protein [Noviherbaspirillum sp.]HYD94655.1 DUF4149 domain-containing protein [Noviherbaspirillum sp.]